MSLQEQFEKAQVTRNNGQIDEAVAMYQEVIDQVDGDNDRFWANESLHMIGVAYYQDEKYDLAKEYLEKALGEFRKLDNTDMEAAVLRDLGMIARSQKNFESAEHFLEDSVSLLSGSEQLGHLGISKVKLGMVHADQGELEEAEGLIEEGLKDIEGSTDRFFEVIGNVNLAEIQERSGKIDQAKASLKKAKSLLEGLGGSDKNQDMQRKIQKLSEQLANS